MKDQLLNVALEGDRLVISIGISALAFAVAHAPDLETFDDLGNFLEPEITDEVALAKEIVTELKREEEDGTTLVHRLLDQAAVQAVEGGAEGIEMP